ncbi:hypothetical protein PSN45_003261 [Yamadazyma tenuis]|uniref:Methyltransferase type 11 domain-containing protein n=1 Tax=Candida tenuis (strain ATCC 10573 / BCRC 21748 / CBS 615 / JCM 9827 / NBRC 10315 / NRRL Y-1498 / VKM Y-70) TaxID=590646 RepID=G3AYV0_CANTC|nr:uncharacterized protein CANTEDRAFT_101956 [Yamadazyma tenuis ATCC 10573]EGV65934.1 hypothetical protein CANTEDRAFT_101956 [Yamadazyma tenuis ATCC 10573]WEJ95734.1 hypothetical protein PSN45_003261 [Yamadazyma tenuis]
MTPIAHQTAISSFNSNHTSYDQFRPDFDPISVDKFLQDLGLIENQSPKTDKVILELAAGTGKFTKNLVDHGWKDNLIIVEPSKGMLESFEKNFPGIKTHLNSSYDIPAEDASVDSVIVAQGFHWFADRDSLKEIKRVLKPSGTFGCIWNYDGPSPSQVDVGSKTHYLLDNSLSTKVHIPEGADSMDISNSTIGLHKWNVHLVDYIYSFDVDVPQYRTGVWKKVLMDNEYFKPIEVETYFYKISSIPKHSVFQYWLTRSFITKLSDEEKVKCEKTINEIIDKYVTDDDKIQENGNIYLQRVLGTHSIVAFPK